MQRSILVTVIIAAFMSVKTQAGAGLPDMQYINRWITMVYPEAIIDSSTCYVIDGVPYDYEQVESVLARCHNGGRQLSFADYIPAERIYENLKVNRGNRSSFVFLSTSAERSKKIRKKLRLYRSCADEFEYVQAGLEQLAGEEASCYIGRLKPKDINGLHLAGYESEDHPKGELAAKVIAVWLK